MIIPLKAYCGKEQAIYGVSSAYSTGHRDRIWKFFCKKIEQPKCFNCETSSEYDTQYQQHIAFNCPPNQVISGLESVHNNGREDRIWKFRCCANFEHVHCELTGYIINLGLDSIVGLHSYSVCMSVMGVMMSQSLTYRKCLSTVTGILMQV